MAGPIETIKAEWGVIMTAPWSFVIVGAAFFGAALGIVKLLDSSEINAANEHRDLYADCLKTGSFTAQCKELSKDAPKPPPVTINKYTSDPSQSVRIKELEQELSLSNYKLDRGTKPKRLKSISKGSCNENSVSGNHNAQVNSC